MKIAWFQLLSLLLTTHCALSQVDDVEINNELSQTTPKAELDANLRKALLKALTDLENEETTSDDKNIEKVPASSVSIISNGVPLNSTPSTTTPEPTEGSVVVLQKSQGVQHPPLTSFEKSAAQPEQILTSASSSFKKTQPGPNAIDTSEKPTPSPTTPEENEARVADVQFFSAPLVAAFTVHQDELGLPKKVEPIYKSAQTHRVEEQLKLRELRRLQESSSLEQEIQRLSFGLKQQQELLLRQQQFLRAQQLPARVDPLVEAGQLPLNAQILPIKEPVNFLTPFVPNQQRFYRQNGGLGNVAFNGNTDSFSIQRSLQPSFENGAPGNRFLRSSFESSLTAPKNTRYDFVDNNHRLSSLLYASGALGGKSSQDLSLISKVLSYDNNFGDGSRLRQNFYRRF